jgi:hypothetical protein
MTWCCVQELRIKGLGAVYLAAPVEAAGARTSVSRSSSNVVPSFALLAVTWNIAGRVLRMM